MKGISEWIWIVGGIIIGIILFTMGTIIYQNTLRTSLEKRSLEEFSEVVTIINNLCWNYEGNVREYNLELGETVQGIYAADIPHDKYESVQLTNNIIAGQTSSGNNLCIQIQGKREQCEKLDCHATFPFVGAVPKEFSLSALIKGNVFNYFLQFGRKINPVEVEVILKVPSSTTTTLPSPTTTGQPGPTTTTTPGPTTTISGPTTTTNPTPTTSIPSACPPNTLVNLVDSNSMYNYVQYLTQHPRPYGSQWDTDTATDSTNGIKAKLESYGVDNVHFEDSNTYPSKNVVGEIGTGTNVIIVTGGHRDGVSGCPGATDNAGGTATVMEVARVLATCKDKIKTYKLKFVLFDNEENGMYGSHAYVFQHSSENIQGMINFDCIGQAGSSGLTAYRTHPDMSTSADKAGQYLQSQGMAYDKQGQGPAMSDQDPFVDHAGAGFKGYLWAMNYGGVCGACYHCMYGCDDDMTQIDAKNLGWAAKFGVYVLADLYTK
jgi:hypothetical protein